MTNLLRYGLALAATASLASASGGPDGPGGKIPVLESTKITFHPGKGITFDGGDQFKVTLTHRIQSKWRFINMENATDTNGFRTRRVRQKLAGHLFSKEFTFMLQLDHAESTALKDIWAMYEVFSGDAGNITMRLGQGKTRGGRESDGSSGSLEFVERAQASRTFGDARSTGILFEGTMLDQGTLSWHAGAFNTDASGQSSAAAEEGRNNGENELNWTFGVRVEPQGNMGYAESWSHGDLKHSGELQSSFGANLHFGNETTAVGAPDVETTMFNLNAAAKMGNGIAAQAEYWSRSDDIDNGADADATGWYAAGSYTTPPIDGEMQWGFGLRAGMVDMDDAPILLSGPAGLDGASTAILSGVAGDVTEINAVVSAYYHEHKLKTQMQYSFQSADPASGVDSDNHALEVMLTASF